MRGDPKARTAGAGRRHAAAIAALSLAAVLGCREFPIWPGAARPRASAVPFHGEALALTASRTGQSPLRNFTTSQRFKIDFAVDPAVIDPAGVREYVLWIKLGERGAWDRDRSVDARRGSLVLGELKEGVYGLRVSVVAADGQELLAPLGHEEPLAWLCVDRSPPRFRWVKPGPQESLQRNAFVTLEWQVEEMEFGSQPVHFEWTAGSKESWQLAGVLPAAEGKLRLRWQVPAVDDDQIRLRVSARDFIGNQGSRELAVQLRGGLPPYVGPAPAGAGARAVDLDPDPAPARLSRSEGAVAAAAQARPAGTAAAAAPAPAHGPAREEASPERRNAAGEAAETAPATASTRTAAGEAGAEARRRPPALEPSLKLLNFNDGAPNPGGVARYVFFEARGLDAGTAVRIEWAESEGAEWQSIHAGVRVEEGRGLWRLPDRSVPEARLRLSARSGDRELIAASPMPIPIDLELPVCSIQGLRHAETGAQQVLINAFDRGPAGLAEVKLFLAIDDGPWQELAVADWTKPIPLPAVRGRIGLYAWARDRVGWETTPLSPTSKAQRIFQVGQKTSLTIQDVAEAVLRGGEELTVNWRYEGDAPEALAFIDISANGGAEWEILDQARLGSGRSVVALPLRDGDAFVVRVRARLADASLLESRTRRFAIDASPPQLEVGPLPERAAASLAVPLRLSDPGGAGVDRIIAHVRRRGETAWRELPAAALSYEDQELRLSLTALDEDVWELHLGAVDKAGNGPPPLDASIQGQGRFTIDRTAPSLRVRPTVSSWVEGQLAVVEVSLDPADVVPPLIAEGREPGGGWQEIYRWASLPPGEDLYRFPLPPAARAYELRFSIRDSAGNAARALLPPMRVEPAIALEPIAAEGLVAGTTVALRWRLHALLDELRSELKVEVSYRPLDQDAWHQVHDELPIEGACLWALPRKAPAALLLRARLFHFGRVIGEAIYPEPLHIEPPGVAAGAAAAVAPDGAGAPAAPLESDPGRLAARAWAQLRAYGEKRRDFEAWRDRQTAGLRRDPASGALVQGEWEKLPGAVRAQAARREGDLRESLDRVQQSFERAVELDATNVEAAYGLASLYLNHRSGREDETRRWLQQTVKLSPKHVDALNDLGALAIRGKRYSEAARVLEAALACEDQPEIRYNLGLALLYSGKPGRAAEQFQAALAAKGKSLDAGRLHYYLVLSWIRDGQSAAAAQWLRSHRGEIPKALAAKLDEALAER
jgi:tetratricopeptide (TPR) repeat protein